MNNICIGLLIKAMEGAKDNLAEKNLRGAIEGRNRENENGSALKAA